MLTWTLFGFVNAIIFRILQIIYLQAEIDYPSVWLVDHDLG